MSRAVLVTGASGGIGRATVRAFGQLGDRVAIHCRRSLEVAEGLRRELPGGEHVVVQADLSEPAAIRAMVDEAADALGGIDVLVNNAGHYRRHIITDVSYEEWQAEWRRAIDVNLIGAANVIWCVVRHMRSGGQIVNVSSRGAFRGEPKQPAYGASKAGLNSMGQSLAVALGHLGISVTTVAPGYVDTAMAEHQIRSPQGGEIRAQSPLFQRVATPEEVAEAIVWLASPSARWATGAVLDFNGASYLRT